MAVPFILLLLAAPHEHRTAEAQFNWDPTPRIEHSGKACDDEALNELPAVYGPVAPNLAILPLAQCLGIRGQELHAPWAFVRLPSLRAPPNARSRSSVI